MKTSVCLEPPCLSNRFRFQFTLLMLQAQHFVWSRGERENANPAVWNLVTTILSESRWTSGFSEIWFAGKIRCLIWMSLRPVICVIALNVQSDANSGPSLIKLFFNLLTTVGARGEITRMEPSASSRSPPLLWGFSVLFLWTVLMRLCSFIGAWSLPLAIIWQQFPAFQGNASFDPKYPFLSLFCSLRLKSKTDVGSPAGPVFIHRWSSEGTELATGFTDCAAVMLPDLVFLRFRFGSCMYQRGQSACRNAWPGIRSALHSAQRLTV